MDEKISKKFSLLQNECVLRNLQDLQKRVQVNALGDALENT